MLLITVSPKGTVEDICLTKSLEPQIDAEIIKTVRRWHFKPARGFDGKPFAIREQLEFTFNLLPNP